MATGRAVQRRGFVGATVADVSWLFTEAQSQAFETWFKDTISDGADWFNVRLKTPAGLTLYQCKFAGMYTGPTLTAGFWRFGAALEFVERPVISEAWYEVGIEFFAGASIIDLALNREWPQ
jgi:hypothetical protein